MAKAPEPMYYGWITGKPGDRVWLAALGWKLGRYDEATITFCDVSGPLSAWLKLERERKEQNVPRRYGLTQTKPNDKTDQEIEESTETLFDGATSSKGSPTGVTPVVESSAVEAVISTIAPPAKRRRGPTASVTKTFINKSLW